MFLYKIKTLGFKKDFKKTIYIEIFTVLIINVLKYMSINIETFYL